MLLNGHFQMTSFMYENSNGLTKPNKTKAFREAKKKPTCTWIQMNYNIAVIFSDGSYMLYTGINHIQSISKYNEKSKSNPQVLLHFLYNI